MIKVYGIKNCDNVKKALTFFKKHDLEYTFFDYKQNVLSCETISEWLKQTDMKTLFNQKSTTYRNLKLKELNLDEKGQEDWLCKENLLIKRPVIEYDNKVFIGFNDDIYQRSFL